MGGIKAGYYTGWLNLVGLIAIVASVAYGAATFFDYSISRFSESWAANYSLERVFVIFLVILLKEGATHWGVSDVFTGRVNNTFGLHVASSPCWYR